MARTGRGRWPSIVAATTLLAGCGEGGVAGGGAANESSAPAPTIELATNVVIELLRTVADRPADGLAKVAEGSPLRRALRDVAGQESSLGWVRNAARWAASATFEFAIDDGLALVGIGSPESAGARGLIATVSSAGPGTPGRATALVELSGLDVWRKLAPLQEAIDPAVTRRLVMLLDGFLQASLAPGRGSPQDFLSDSAPPFEEGSESPWPRFLTASFANGTSSLASVATFDAVARSSTSILVRSRVERRDRADAVETVDIAVGEARVSDLLVLFRPLSPAVSGTQWGIGAILECAGE